MSLESPALKPSRRLRRTDSDRLRDALLALCDHRGHILNHKETPWASITFAGARHTFALLFYGEDAVAAGEAFIAQLPEHEFTIPGQIVADANVTECRHRLVPFPRLTITCELLLLEDA